MTSKIGRETTNIWNQPSGHQHHHHQSHGHDSPWGGVFKVEWITHYDLPFGDTLHLRNPWNENKPVKISRDGQELPADIGRELCKLLDQGAASVEKKRKTSSSSEYPESKKQKHETDVTNNNNNNDSSSVNTNQREGESSTSSRSRSKHTSRRSRSRSPRRSRSPKRGRSRSPRDRSRSYRTEGERYPRHRRSKSRSRSRSPSRKSRSSMDLLSMTYEDYLSAVNDKYRWAQNPPFPGFLPGFSEIDYMNYMAWVAKQQSGSADMYSYQSSRRRK